LALTSDLEVDGSSHAASIGKLFTHTHVSLFTILISAKHGDTLKLGR